MDHPISPSNESGFSLVEVLISLTIFLIASAGVSYALVQSDRQMINAEHILNGEQYGMAQSVSNTATAPVLSERVSGQSQSLSMPVALTLSPAQPTQACTPGLVNGIGQLLGNLLSSISCIFGGCTTTPATVSPTSYTVSVPVTAYTISQSQVAWWNP